ncbi:hypothetical protein [Frateuria sp. Soil773]|uniref:hypothetical protein n=1 Tax=Frateuria sp. Soil773 TaxID=1736407 RepID=UPI0012F9D198|nr:hypothetical protein [Frateuria sp. Soil773]
MFALVWTTMWVVGTVALVAWTQYRLRFKQAWWWVAFFGLFIGACVLLGVRRGPVAWVVGNLIAWCLSTDRFQNWLDCRRAGKRLAAEIGIKPNLLFTAIELAFERSGQKGASVLFFAGLNRNPDMPKDEIYRTIMPGLVIGFDMLENRFGPQQGIEEAKARIRPLVRQYCDDPPDWA